MQTQMNTSTFLAPVAGVITAPMLFSAFLVECKKRLSRGYGGVYNLENPKARALFYHEINNGAEKFDWLLGDAAAILVCHVGDFPLTVAQRVKSIFRSGGNNATINRLCLLTSMRIARLEQEETGMNGQKKEFDPAKKAAEKARREANRQMRNASSLRKGPSGGGSNKKGQGKKK